MNKTLKFYGILFILILVILGIILGAIKENNDWSKNFDIEEKTPFGLFVFNQESKNFFNSKLKKVHQSPFNYYDTIKTPHNILFVQKDTDRKSWEKILKQVENGSDLLYITDRTYTNLRDTLNGISIRTYYYEDITGVLEFNDPKRKSKVVVDKFPTMIGLSSIAAEAEVLGTFKGKDSHVEFANFVKIPFGKGTIYHHTEPLILTNYHLLKNKDYSYVQEVFSYLPNRETIWFVDEIETGDLIDTGHPLAFVFKNPPLKYAWWMFLLGLILLMIFRAKRTQRIIPIIEPKKNKSVEFVKSIGNLYLQEGDFHDLMNKKMNYFLHHLRVDFFIDTSQLNDEFIKKIHLKTGAKVEDIQELVQLNKKLNHKNETIKKLDLIRLDQIIDKIVKK